MASPKTKTHLAPKVKSPTKRSPPKSHSRQQKRSPVKSPVSRRPVRTARGEDKPDTTVHDDSQEGQRELVGIFEQDFHTVCRRYNLPLVPVTPRRHTPLEMKEDTSLERVVSLSSQRSPGSASQKSQEGRKRARGVLKRAASSPSAMSTGEPPFSTFVVCSDSFQYFKPRVHVRKEVRKVGEEHSPPAASPPGVTDIYIRGWKVDMKTLEALQTCWKHVQTLHTLNLWRVGLTGGAVYLLSCCLHVCRNLTHLLLDANPVQEQNYHELLEARVLQTLSLRHCSVDDTGAARIGEALGTASTSDRTLLTLDLSGNAITDLGAAALAGGLRTNRTLLVLGLANNRLGDQGAAALGQTLSQFPLSQDELVQRRRLNLSRLVAQQRTVLRLALARLEEARLGRARYARAHAPAGRKSRVIPLRHTRSASFGEKGKEDKDKGKRASLVFASKSTGQNPRQTPKAQVLKTVSTATAEEKYEKRLRALSRIYDQAAAVDTTPGWPSECLLPTVSAQQLHQVSLPGTSSTTSLTRSDVKGKKQPPVSTSPRQAAGTPEIREAQRSYALVSPVGKGSNRRRTLSEISTVVASPKLKDADTGCLLTGDESSAEAEGVTLTVPAVKVTPASEDVKKVATGGSKTTGKTPKRKGGKKASPGQSTNLGDKAWSIVREELLNMDFQKMMAAKEGRNSGEMKESKAPPSESGSRQSGRSTREKKEGRTGTDGKSTGKRKSGKASEKIESTPEEKEQKTVFGPGSSQPLMEDAVHIGGQLWLPGNRVLVSLNVSRNKIREPGLQALLKAVQFQATLTQSSDACGKGLMRLCVHKNEVPADCQVLRELEEAMRAKDPFYRDPNKLPVTEVSRLTADRAPRDAASGSLS